MFENKDDVWNSTLADHIGNMIHGGSYKYNNKDLKTLPSPIKHLHFLWRAQLDIGGSGFNYLYQGQALEIIGIYNAFVEIGATELVTLMNNAIALANESTAEYVIEIEDTNLFGWFSKFEDSGKFKHLEDHELNEKAWTLVTDYLNAKILTYINENIEEIAE